ncbi:hypothetical protein [Vreelandella boliviensis]|uniref:hypothetical protein n=1 Tax=Vreelandella boliviensis TaxID=223527 RepID=UPI001B8ABAF9|nr:hypothetical protein [Halomonas boliviensis]MBS3668914.1 hypothetical protein [Halomonas boliviensis]
MAKVSQQQKEEYKYKQFKKALDLVNGAPESAAETHLVCNKLRNGLRLKFYTAGASGIFFGLLTLIFLVGILPLGLGIAAIVFGRKDIRNFNKCEERYIREHFPESLDEPVDVQKEPSAGW